MMLVGAFLTEHWLIYVDYIGAVDITPELGAILGGSPTA